MEHSRANRSAVAGEARRKLATTLLSVFSEAVYDHASLQDDVCNFVQELKTAGFSAHGVSEAARSLVKETAGDFPASRRTDELLSRMLGWCLDAYYRESA